MASGGSLARARANLGVPPSSGPRPPCTAAHARVLHSPRVGAVARDESRGPGPERTSAAESPQPARRKDS